MPVTPKAPLLLPGIVQCYVAVQVVVKRARVLSAAIPDNLRTLVGSHTSSASTSEVGTIVMSLPHAISWVWGKSLCIIILTHSI